MKLVNVLLFLLTVGSTYLAGGLMYCLAIMSILLAHEMGHYLMSRHHSIPASLPYFIPFPFPPFGTFGAIIKMRGFVPDRKALFDTGAAGPMAGFIVALPFIVIGIKLSSIETISGTLPLLRLGDPLLFILLQKLLIGPIPEGYDLVLHPLAYAGWVGLFITAFNLLPAGQLDGGHVVYAVFGNKSRYIFGATILAVALLTIFYYPGWLVLMALLFIFGMRHPEPLDSETGLNRKRRLLAIVILIIFALSFIPAPFPNINFNSSGGIEV